MAFKDLGGIKREKLKQLAQKDLDGVPMTDKEAWEYKVLMDAWNALNDPLAPLPNSFEEDIELDGVGTPRQHY